MDTYEQERAAKILADYEILVRLMQNQKSPHKEVQPLQPQDVMYLKAKMHPTAKAESINMTRELLNFLYEHRIATAEEIYNSYSWSDKPVMKRLKLLKEFGIIRRVSKKYYLATPRLDTIITKYMDRLC